MDILLLLISPSPQYTKLLLMLLSPLFLVVLCSCFSSSALNVSDAFSPLFSKFNIQPSPDHSSVSLLLNRLSGSGIISSDYYDYGFFSANIKMPSQHTAGVCVAFYTSNVDTFEKNHDELDVEFLGNVRGQPWRFQTNMYGNGSVSRGREERYRLWFDPTTLPHRYSILWTPQITIFYVDEIPIREIVRNAAMRGDYPSKPMSLYATIWDASSWATNGGKEKVDYTYEPFVAEFRDVVLHGCVVDPTDQIPSSNCTNDIAALTASPYSTITPAGRRSMKWFRQNYMYYSYCYDRVRYPVAPPECVVIPSEREMLTETGRVRGSVKAQRRRERHRRGKGRRGRSKSVSEI
ncbi:probable xyloglucan endotransglucosylase/hydrolase protein 30 [Andrographis paniculata]|uniref:probable xyloglucan endotransglucosylase/hydrolase protein 30 n=1 Tax=Andrographis paniculata TaxID=175694 RepID=UPI0021E7BD47|nr:probable xyloglucan endotransglucosylase/hydrolase protein 30 [Andrographis paniculata]